MVNYDVSFFIYLLLLCYANLQVVGQALIETLEKGLGDKFTPEVKEAYIEFYKMVADNMKEGLHEAYAMQNDA